MLIWSYLHANCWPSKSVQTSKHKNIYAQEQLVAVGFENCEN